MKRLSSNSELGKSLSPLNMLKGGLLMLIANQINKILLPFCYSAVLAQNLWLPLVVHMRL